MRNYVLLLVGVCLLQPALGHAQAAATSKPQPPATTAKPAAPDQAKPAVPARKEIKVTEKVLATYVGDYEMAPGRVLAITLEKGSLWGQPGDSEKRQLFAETQTKFFLKELPVVITFNKEKTTVVGLTMEQEGRPTREAKKIK